MRNSTRCLMAAAFLSTFTCSSGALAVQWQNETGSALECDYCNLQWPYSVVVNAGMPSPMIYGQIYEMGVTESLGANSAILAQLGYGPAGTDPRINSQWHWVAATYNVQVGNNDEYMAQLQIPFGGSYSYTFRYSLDQGASFTAGDLDGAGSNGGLSFEGAQLGSLTVVGSPPPPVPEPETYAMMMAGLGLLGLVARKKMGA